MLAPVEVCGKFSLDEFDQQRLNPSVKAPLKIDLHVGQQLVLKYVFSWLQFECNHYQVNASLNSYMYYKMPLHFNKCLVDKNLIFRMETKKANIKYKKVIHISQLPPK